MECRNIVTFLFFKNIKFKLKSTMESSAPVMENHTCYKEEKQKDSLSSQNHLLKTS